MPEYKLFAIPLDAEDPATSPAAFDVRVVWDLQFPSGTADKSSIAAAIAAHPILGRSRPARIPGLVMKYDDWQSGGRLLNSATPGNIPVVLTHVAGYSLAALRETLSNYLFRAEPAIVSTLAHDQRFDDLLEDDFVNIVSAHDDLTNLRAELQRAALANFGVSRGLLSSSAAIENFSYDQARWINGHVQAILIDALFAPAALRPAIRAEFVGTLNRLRSAVAKVQRRADPSARTPRAVLHTMRAATQRGETTVAPGDPNVAMHAAFSSTLLAESCGITTTWRATASQPLVGDYVLLLDAAALVVDATIAPVSTQPTAFRRKDHTHPLSFLDINRPVSTNTSLACLSGDTGEPRYRATSINAEASIFQNTILQANNSISNSTPQPAHGIEFKDTRDDRPPQLLEGEQLGFNEPESGGLTISAPTEDLLTPRPLADLQRAATLPCLFLEDLWVGYRLDLAPENGSRFLSVHRQTQEITFSATGRKIQGATEDFIAREQPGDPDGGATSTELYQYQGLNSAQLIDYLKFVGTYREPIVSNDVPFKSAVIGYTDATPLHFGRIYRYRLRNVFLGATSLSDRDANLDRLGRRYVQAVPFYRARAYRPGEVVSEQQQAEKPNAQGRSIFLSEEHSKASIWVVPSPLDTETARYHATFLARVDEPQRNSHRAFVKDVAKFFKDRPTKLHYFYDPEVNEIAVRVTMLNGHPDDLKRDFSFQSGAFSELVQHFTLPTVRARFGRQGNWEKFRPIQISFSTTNSLVPEITKRPGLGDAINLRILVPPGADMEVSMLPIVNDAQLRTTAARADSSTQLWSRTVNNRLTEPFVPIPAVAESKLRVIHSLKRPTLNPVFASSPLQTGSPADPVAVAERGKFKETAELDGYIQLDAASTGQLRLEASWSDVDDNPIFAKFTLNSATAVTVPHSISFERYRPPAAPSVARQHGITASALRIGSRQFFETFDLQSAENKVFLGPSAPQQSGRPRPCVVNFSDMRRKQARITAVAVSRYKSHFGPANASSFETRSDPLFVEVPASIRLASPEISHVVPLSREIRVDARSGSKMQRLYAMRIYVKRPWFLSGPGERLAIACRAGHVAELPTASLNKYVSQWGEDPVERPKLDITRRSPRASDFRNLQDNEFIPDEALYSPRSVEGASPVIYRDSIIRTLDDVDSRIVSLASFALRRDVESSLWYCDVEVGDAFEGWCGLALYRHQPHAHEGTQLSESPAWVYGAVLHGETVVWFAKDRKLHITVGPVFDPYTEFVLDANRYRHGVSGNLQTFGRQPTALRKYAVSKQVYFEGVVAEDDLEWSLVKKRFGHQVASIGLHRDRVQ